MSDTRSPGFAAQWRSYARLPALQRTARRAGMLFGVVVVVAVMVLIVRIGGAVILALWRATSWG